MTLTTKYGRAALLYEEQAIESSVSSFRYKDTLRAATKIGGLVATGHISYLTASQSLIRAAELSGMQISDANRLVRKGLAKGQQQPRVPNATPRVENRTDVTARCLAVWHAAVNDPQLQSRTGHTTLKIIHAVLARAIQVGHLSVSFSYRQIAEQAGVSLQTVTRHVSNVERYLYVKTGRKFGTENRGSVWQVRHVEPADNALDVGEHFVGESLSAPNDNYWHKKSLRWRIYSLLHIEDGLTARQLAEKTGSHAGSVRKILRQLETDGLATEAYVGWVRTPDATAPESPQDYKALRKERHAREREYWLTVQKPFLLSEKPVRRSYRPKRKTEYVFRTSNQTKQTQIH